MITGTVVFDLTAAKKPENLRHRVGAIPDVPTGARVIVIVGALAPEPEVLRVIAAHERRLLIDVRGTPAAVRRWLGALRDDQGLV